MSLYRDELKPSAIKRMEELGIEIVDRPETDLNNVLFGDYDLQSVICSQYYTDESEDHCEVYSKDNPGVPIVKTHKMGSNKKRYSVVKVLMPTGKHKIIKKSRVIWMINKGPINENLYILHKDGDHTNFDLDNLMQATPEQARRYQ